MNIIVVDDEQYALLDLEQAIREATKPVSTIQEMNIACFNEASEALIFAKKNKVYIAFLDIEMGGMNGLELAKELREINNKTNIIFATGYNDYALDAFSVNASGYLLKPITAQAVAGAMEHLRNPVTRFVVPGQKIRVQCFGNFEVFLDNKPLYFKRRKAKELLAYLIHKRGTSSSVRELAAVLYENKEDSISLQNQVQTLISTMMMVLTDAGARNVIIKNYNNIAVDISMIDCDYFRFLMGDTQAVNTYTGEYMSNYSWAEFTLGYLDSKISK